MDPRRRRQSYRCTGTAVHSSATSKYVTEHPPRLREMSKLKENGSEQTLRGRQENYLQTLWHVDRSWSCQLGSSAYTVPTGKPLTQTLSFPDRPGHPWNSQPAFLSLDLCFRMSRWLHSSWNLREWLFTRKRKAQWHFSCSLPFWVGRKRGSIK